MNNQKYVTIYTLGIALFAALLSGFKTTQGFLTGTIEPFLYDLGIISGGFIVPLGIALLLATVRYFYLRLRKKPRNFLLNWMQIGAVIATIFLIVVFQMPKMTIDNDQARKIAWSIQKDLEDSLSTGVSEGVKLEGDFGRFTALVNILNDLRLEVATIQKEIKTEIDQYDFENLFAEHNITNIENINRLKSSLSKTVSKIKDSIVGYKEIQNKFVMRVTQADMPSIQKQQFLNGFEEKRPDADKAFNGFMKNEISTYQKLIEIFSFFEASQGKFKVIEKMPYFISEVDSKSFNELITDMQILGAKRDGLAQKMIAQQLYSIKTLDEYTD
jgi:hypothetical protein